MKKITILATLLLTVSFAFSQVSLAPTAVFLDKNGVGNLYVTNNSNTPQEITVNFQFGYSYQDKNGVLVIVYDDSVRREQFGLDKMVKAFPKNFTLGPKQQQVVRLQARPGKNLADGVYFTRLKVGSAGQSAEIGDANNSGITTKVNVRYEQVIAAFYKKGEVSTGVMIDGVDAKFDSNFVSLNYKYRVTGNAPFLGRITAKILDMNGKVIGNSSQILALYFEGSRIQNFNISEKLPAGSYQVELEFDTKRNDISTTDLIAAKAYTHKAIIKKTN